VEHLRVSDFDPHKRTLRLQYSKTGERRVKLRRQTAPPLAAYRLEVTHF